MESKIEFCFKGEKLPDVIIMATDKDKAVELFNGLKDVPAGQYSIIYESNNKSNVIRYNKE